MSPGSVGLALRRFAVAVGVLVLVGGIALGCARSSSVEAGSDASSRSSDPGLPDPRALGTRSLRGADLAQAYDPLRVLGRPETPTLGALTVEFASPSWKAWLSGPALGAGDVTIIENGSFVSFQSMSLLYVPFVPRAGANSEQSLVEDINDERVLDVKVALLRETGREGFLPNREDALNSALDSLAQTRPDETFARTIEWQEGDVMVQAVVLSGWTDDLLRDLGRHLSIAKAGSQE